MTKRKLRVVKFRNSCFVLSTVSRYTKRVRGALTTRPPTLTATTCLEAVMADSLPNTNFEEFPHRHKIAVSEDGCWLWLGANNERGYGCMTVNKKNIKAHRFAWQWRNGPIPEGVHVLHRCDNPPCVNPDHLFLGTIADNMRDMVAKGRHAHGRRMSQIMKLASPRGEAHHAAVLTEKSVLEILCDPRSYSQIARSYGVCAQTVCNVKTGRLWSHVTGIYRECVPPGVSMTGAIEP